MLVYLFFPNTLDVLHFLFVVHVSKFFKRNPTQVRKPALCDVQRLVTTPTTRFWPRPLRPPRFSRLPNVEGAERHQEAANRGLKRSIFWRSVDFVEVRRLKRSKQEEEEEAGPENDW